MFICLDEKVSSILMMVHEALGKTQNRNTLMLRSLHKGDTGFHTSAVT